MLPSPSGYLILECESFSSRRGVYSYYKPMARKLLQLKALRPLLIVPKPKLLQ